MKELELLSEGWGLIEAPRVDDDDCLHFSDVPNGGVYKRFPDGEIETVIPKRRGLCLDLTPAMAGRQMEKPS